MTKLIKKYSHAWVLLYCLIYMPWFMWLERTVTTDFSVVHLSLDDKIPFMEIFVIPYFLWFAYIFVTVAYFFFKDRGEFYRCSAYLFIGMTICLLIYTIWPNGHDLCFRNTVERQIRIVRTSAPARISRFSFRCLLR